MVRFKNRWLLLTLAAEPPAIPDDYDHYIPFSHRAPNVNAYSITKAIRASLRDNFGDVSAGAYAGPLTCKYYSPKSGIGILRSSRDGVRQVWAATTLLNTIDGHRVRICVRSCGGTIRKVQRKAISIDKTCILRLEQARQKNKDAVRTASSEYHARSGQESMNASNAQGDADDLGVSIEEDDDMGVSIDEGGSDSFEDTSSNGADDLEESFPVSDECKREIAESRSVIMSITRS